MTDILIVEDDKELADLVVLVVFQGIIVIALVQLLGGVGQLLF